MENKKKKPSAKSIFMFVFTLMLLAVSAVYIFKDFAPKEKMAAKAAGEFNKIYYYDAINNAAKVFTLNDTTDIKEMAFDGNNGGYIFYLQEGDTRIRRLDLSSDPDNPTIVGRTYEGTISNIVNMKSGPISVAAGATSILENNGDIYVYNTDTRIFYKSTGWSSPKCTGSTAVKHSSGPFGTLLVYCADDSFWFRGASGPSFVKQDAIYTQAYKDLYGNIQSVEVNTLGSSVLIYLVTDRGYLLYNNGVDSFIKYYPTSQNPISTGYIYDEFQYNPTYGFQFAAPMNEAWTKIGFYQYKTDGLHFKKEIPGCAISMATEWSQLVEGAELSFAATVRSDCQADKVKLTTSINGNGGVAGTGISCPGDCEEYYTYSRTNPQIVTLTETPASSLYKFDGWDGACSGTGTTCTVTMSENKNVVANFSLNTGTVNVTSNKAMTSPFWLAGPDPYNKYDTITSDGGSKSYSDAPPGDYSIACPPLSGYNVSSSVSPSNSLAPGGMITFACTYTLTVTFNKNGGTTEANPTTKTAIYGGNVGTLPIPPTKTGYTFASWNTKSDGTGTSFTATTPVTASITVYAQWAINTYTVTFNKNGGTINAVPTTKTATYGGNVGTLPIPPTRIGGYIFAGWNTLSNGAGTDFTATTPVTASITVYAQWATSSLFNLNASAGANGTIAPLGVTVKSAGSSQAYIITPNINYHVADVLVDSVSVGAVTSYTFFNITASHFIVATFAINTFNIVASATTNGTLTPTGTTVKNAGSSQTYTITPNTDYHIADVLVDSVSVGAVTKYVFSNINANHTIFAIFIANECTADPKLLYGIAGVSKATQNKWQYSTAEILSTCREEYRLYEGEGRK